MENCALAEHTEVDIDGSALYYKLYLVEKSYCISVSLNGNCCYVSDFTVNDDFALYVFKRVVSGAVYPVHLHDIIEDFVSDYEPGRDYTILASSG